MAEGVSNQLYDETQLSTFLLQLPENVMCQYDTLLLICVVSHGMKSITMLFLKVLRMDAKCLLIFINYFMDDICNFPMSLLVQTGRAPAVADKQKGSRHKKNHKWYFSRSLHILETKILTSRLQITNVVIIVIDKVE